MRARTGRRAAALSGVLVLVLLLAGAAHGEDRARWDTRVLAKVPAPGFPAKPYVDPRGRLFEGTYVNPAGDKLPSKVFEFGSDGAMLGAISVPNQSLSEAHGVQVVTSDARGRLVLLDRTPSRALLMDPDTAEVRTYAEFPDLKPCGSGGATGSCSPTLNDAAPFADYAAWGPDGSLYVTDYEQAVVFRVPPGGGTPTVWLADRRLDGQMFGTAGIALAADRRTLLITQASGLGLGAGNPLTGRLYAVEIQPDGTPGELRQLWESAAADAPDGFAIAKSGDIYIALVGLSAQLVVLAPDGAERERFPAVYGTGENGSPVPFDSPSGLAFLGTRLIVANQSALVGDTSHQVLLDVEAGEAGLPELIPANAGFSEAQFAKTAAPRIGTIAIRKGRRIIVTLSRGIAGAPAAVRLTRHGRTVATGVLRGRTLRLLLRDAATPSGRHTLRPRSSRSKLEPTSVELRATG